LTIPFLKTMSVPKLAVLTTGLAAAMLAATLSPQAAQASPTEVSACTGCHAAGGSVVATPASATQAPGASYTVALAYTGGDGSADGYWISGSDGSSATGSSATTASMTAPAAAGTYTYTVWVRSGVTASTTYTITVAAGTTPPSTTPVTPPATTPVTPPATTPVTPPATTPVTTPVTPATTAPATTPPVGASTTTPAGAGAPAVLDSSAVIPVGAPDTGAGGASAAE